MIAWLDTGTMMRLSVGPCSIPAGQVLNPGQVPFLHQHRFACGFWFWQGPLPTVYVFWAATGRLDLEGRKGVSYVWTGGCIAEGK
jgi:hypothetical protein